ncbi:hypothetical protein E3C22_13870 [Jiella endophytica]|uniref:Vanadium-dependent haloperoxidase n=1 Tax=Jiella endophytica TaxID=2558362 RepID=A0A4Y8RH66_9HYPH|nr:vanadium-dependent haloperoxidase [Jiella endophytica]TFF21766.1 hypothetical protein E3C22_13870 [Jiella endophytica]
MGAATAQDRDHPLRALSQHDFYRVFGTTPSPSAQSDAARAASEQRWAQRVAGIDDMLSAVVEKGQFTDTTLTNSTALLKLLKQRNDPMSYLYLWHLVALDTTAVDHAPTGPGIRHQQVGPARSSRALAMVHQALFEVANTMNAAPYATTLKTPHTFDLSLPGGLSAQQRQKYVRAREAAALSEAAYLTLELLYPSLRETTLNTAPPSLSTVSWFSQGAARTGFSDALCNELTPSLSLHVYYQCSLQAIEGDNDPDVAILKLARENGVAVGREIAGTIKAEREGDNARLSEPELDDSFEYRYRPDERNRAFVQWMQDPVSKISTALGGNWMHVKPFAMKSSYQFRPSEADAPRIDLPVNGTPDQIRAAARKLKSYNAVARWGTDPRLDGTGAGHPGGPKLDRFFLAQYWAYDGTAYLCAPPRLYNQIALTVLMKIRDLQAQGAAPELAGREQIDLSSTADVSRFLALVNFAMADTAIAAWDAKFYFQFPRPVTYIRAVQALDPNNEATDGLEPSGAEALSMAMSPSQSQPAAGGFPTGQSSDQGQAGVPYPVQEASALTTASTQQHTLPRGSVSQTKWFPAGAQVTNSDSPYNITPPFPAYVSGHAAFGGALFGMLRQFVGPKTEFAFESDEFNGFSKDVFNYVRCEAAPGGGLRDKVTPAKFCAPRPLTLDCAERENADSRLWMGVHWIDDADDGVVLGNRVSRQVYDVMMAPKTHRRAQAQFSVQPADYPTAGKTMREKLLCRDIAMSDLPAGWDSENGEVGFGQLDLVNIEGIRP